MNSYGIWKVTAKIEDRPVVKQLGYYAGYIDNIALHLGKEEYRFLEFEQIDVTLMQSDTSDNNVDEVMIKFHPFATFQDSFSTFVKDTFCDRDCMVDIEILPDNFVKISRKMTKTQKAKKRLDVILNRHPEDKDEILKLIEDLKGDDE